MDNARRLEIATRATYGSRLYMTETVRFNTIAILTNLTALETNRILMLRGAGLLDKNCRAVHTYERSDVLKQCIALAIMVSFEMTVRRGDKRSALARVC